MTNAEFELAEQFALQTRKHCFVTGKAGTGKTTLLKRIVEQTQKNVVVVAPTGVAAINAGGVTIHSMFGLPLTCFVPADDVVDPNIATNRRRLLSEHLRLRKDKLRVLREMDLLIVDEVSMVRADMLDAVDLVLRTVRGNPQPFGDVQILLFGDMHQLPPVAKDPEWSILKTYYRSPYFFDSLAWPQLQAVQIELRTIYRQSDARFLSLLNNIRNRRMDADDYERLRERYDPAFDAAGKGYVLLSTHNYKANAVNTSELEKLAGKTYSFTAEITGDFAEHLFPCDPVLHLKAGSQVMFIRNDSEAGRYYNGKLAVVKRIDDEGIIVTFNDGGEDYALRRETWENIGFSVEAESGKVVRQELGTFSQFPLRLAWAITIHKSQGLTFDKVIIDAGRSFAPGQVYVALSRCRSLDGIVLHSLISPGALHGDQRIGEFSASHHAADELRDVLGREKSLYANHLLLKLFAFTELSGHVEEWQALLATKELPDKEAATALHARIRAHVHSINTVAERFQRQLQRLIAAMDGDPANTEALKDRCAKAIGYFTDQIATGLIAPLREHTASLAYKKKLKRYVRHLQLMEESGWIRIERLYDGRFLDARLYTGERAHSRDRMRQVVTSVTSAKAEKGATYKDTLELHRQGKAAPEIAEIRGLAVSTIKSHLARWVASGDVNVYDIVPTETIEPVLAFLQENRSASVTEIRSALGGRFDYNDIRMILSHHSRHSANRSG